MNKNDTASAECLVCHIPIKTGFHFCAKCGPPPPDATPVDESGDLSCAPCPWCRATADEKDEWGWLITHKPTCYWLTTHGDPIGRVRVNFSQVEQWNQWSTQKIDVEKHIAEASSLSNRGRFEEAFNVLVHTLRAIRNASPVSPASDPVVQSHKFQSMHGTDSCWHCDSDYAVHPVDVFEIKARGIISQWDDLSDLETRITSALHASFNEGAKAAALQSRSNSCSAGVNAAIEKVQAVSNENDLEDGGFFEAGFIAARTKAVDALIELRDTVSPRGEQEVKDGE